MPYPTTAESELFYSTLPLWIVLLPIAGSFLVYRAGLIKPWLRDYSAVLVAGTTLALALALFIRSGEAVTVLQLRTGFIDPLLYFRVDSLGALITLLTAVIWFLATVFSMTYMNHEGDQNRYYLFYLLSLGSCLGVFMAGDLLTLFLFFEVMTFTSYVLVVHARTKESDDAGRNYLFLGVIGGLALLVAIMLLFFNTGSVELAPRLENLEQMGGLRYLVAVLLIAGFGVKAGAVPLHIWLPKAHPVAPSPASALLSGLMIKTGAYGILRVVNLLFTPASPETGSWQTTGELGTAMIWVGIATMFIAAFTALFQNNAKRILAYSSVSQMGYILMGLGCAAYLGYQGAMGLSGTIYHIINHAFFKASMFILVGAVYVRTHQLDLNRLGGLWRSFPVTTIAFLAAAAGITGVPGLNGYTSKTLIHHAIEDVYKYSGDPSFLVAEKIFTVTSALTVCYIIKLTTGIFFGKRPPELAGLQRETFSERIVFGIFAAAIIALGSWPSLAMEKLILPAGAGLNLDPYKLDYLAKLNFWSSQDLLAIGQVLLLGLLLFVFLRRLLYRVQLPGWLSVEQLLYRPLVRFSGAFFTGISRTVETAVDQSYLRSPHALRIFTAAGGILERQVDRTYVGLPAIFTPVYRGLEQFEENHLARLGGRIRSSVVHAWEAIHSRWVLTIGTVFRNLAILFKSGFRTLFQFDHDPRGNKVFQTINISNLDFNLLIIVMTLIAVLGVIFFLK